MVDPTVYRPRLQVGAIVARSFRLALDNVALLLPITIVAEALRQAIDWAMNGENPMLILPAGDLKEKYDPIGPLLELPHDFVAAIETAAIVWIAYSMLARRPTSFRDAAAAVGRSIVPILLIDLAGNALSAGGDMIRQAMTAFPAAGLVFVVWVPLSVYLTLCWWVAAPAAIIEGRNTIGAFRRSTELTRGHRAAIVGIAIVVALCFLVPAGLLWFASGVGFPPHADIARLSPIGLAATLLELAISMVIGTSTAAIYADLRVFKDGAASPPTYVFA